MLSDVAAASFALLSLAAANVPSPQELGTISILAADNLVTNDTKTTSAAVLINTAHDHADSETRCEALSETLWSPKLQNFRAGLNQSLAYEVFSGRFPSDQLFWIGLNENTASRGTIVCSAMGVTGKTYQVACSTQLPALCTQSAPASNITYADTSTPFQIAQKVGGQTLVGYRDFLTFRYLGVRFAEEPERFTYSSLYHGTGTNMALDPAPECLQAPNNGSTDCLFLNVWTTLLPTTTGTPDKKNLKPVMVYIYGGGFTTGSASNPTNDGGNLAARGDVVVVDLAYRLGTLGFLVLDNGVQNGNYFISDQLAGLQWVQENIEHFGGDPNQVTIFGESAGAVSVQDLIESPEAVGLFHGTIIQSDYYQPSVTKEQAYNQTTTQILKDTNCTTASDRLACLRAVPAVDLINLGAIANYPVIDGKYLTTAYFQFNSSEPKSHVNSVPTMIGVNRDEGGVLAPFFQTSNLTQGIEDIAAAEHLNAAAILNSHDFPLGHGPMPSNQTLNVFNTTTRIYTDNSFRCTSQSLVYGAVKSGALPDVWFYEFNRTYQDPAYNTNGVCLPAPDAAHPYGDPSKEYFKCHAGDVANTFGNVARVGFPARDENDMPFAQLVTDYWTSFARNLNPNPDMAYLEARGYWNTINQINYSGNWPKVDASNPQMIEMQWNSFIRGFRDDTQCSVLGLPLDQLDH